MAHCSINVYWFQRSNTLRYASLVGLTVIGLIMKSIVDDVPRRALPYNSWLPFDYYATLFGYSLAYSTQIVSVMACAAVSTAFDTLLPGLMLQTCAQLNILRWRFHNMSQIVNAQSRQFRRGDEFHFLVANLETKLLAECVKHHIQIFKWGSSSNMIFLTNCTISTIHFFGTHVFGVCT